MSFNLAALRKKAQADRTSSNNDTFDKEKRKQERIQNLREDSNMIRDELVDVIQNAMVRYISRSYNPEDEHVFNIWNLQREECLKKLPLKSNIKPSTFFTGFWDADTCTHNQDLWDDAGINLMLDELNDVLNPVKLVDVSDSGRSFNFVVQCTIPASGEELDENDDDELDEEEEDELDDAKKSVYAASEYSDS